jgi:ammonium transporter Rh
MIFIGFGFLMTFLRKYGYGAVGLTLLAACISIELRPLFAALFEGLFNNHFKKFSLGITALLNCDFAAAAVLISFGGVIGKISATQLLVMALFEVLFYCLNAQIAVYLFITDIGGSMIIHTFGAFFGLAVSKALARSTAAARGIHI